jgi:Arc/MetJ family transcription regulator
MPNDLHNSIFFSNILILTSAATQHANTFPTRRHADTPIRRDVSDLTDAYQLATLICMRTTINLNDELVAKAQLCTGIKEKTRLIHLGLEALIQRDAALRLAALGGSASGAKAGRRKRTAT